MTNRSIFLNSNLFFESTIKKNFDLITFYIGIFLLPSAFTISLIFILFSIIFSAFKYKQIYFNDKVNLIFLSACLVLFISTLSHLLWNNNIANQTNWNSSFSLIGLANWIPLILTFIGSKPFLKTKELRKRFSIILLFGSIPVLFSCFSQYFLKWYGPYEILNGLIVWYQKPLPNVLGVTGLFNNQNYTSAWLNIIWPFAISFFVISKKRKIIRFLIFFFLLSVFVFIILTGSRAGWIGMICAIPLVFGSKAFKWFIPLITFCLSFISSIVLPIFGEGYQIFMKTYIPSFVWINFSSKSYEDWDTSRLNIWQEAIKGINENLFFGNGASSFSYFFEYQTNFWKGHAHNLPLELAFSYGIPATLLIIGPITFMVFKEFKNQYLNRKNISKENIFEKAWLTSLIILICEHMVDIQYFDGRISLIAWLLLAGLRNMNQNSDLQETF